MPKPKKSPKPKCAYCGKVMEWKNGGYRCTNKDCMMNLLDYDEREFL